MSLSNDIGRTERATSELPTCSPALVVAGDFATASLVRRVLVPLTEVDSDDLLSSATGEAISRPDLSSSHPSSRPAKLALVVVVLVFVVLGTTIAIKTPGIRVGGRTRPCAEHRNHGKGPLVTASMAFCPWGCSGNETQQAPLYYLLMAGWQHVVALPAHAPFRGTLNPGIYRGASELYLHHSAADDRFLLWLRLPNLALGGLTVLFAFFAVRLTTSDVWTPVIAASKRLPRFLFLSPFVTNDNVRVPDGAVLVFLALRYTLAPGRWRMVVIGVVCGLLVTTKLSTLLLLVIPIFACVVRGGDAVLRVALFSDWGRP